MFIRKVKPALNRKNFEDSKVLAQINKIFLKKRGYAFRVPKKNEPVILSISGGMDSIAIWNMLLGKYQLNVYPVHFLNFNRIYKGEEESVKYYSKFFKKLYPKRFHQVEIIKAYSTNKINKLSSADIINNSKIILNNLIYNQTNDSYKVAVTYNSVPLYEYFFNIYIYAQKLKSTIAKNLNTILTCFVAEDTSLSRNGTLTVMKSINLSLCLILGDFNWQFSACIEKDVGFYFDKKTLIEYATLSGVVLDKSWSCWQNKGKHCGQCGGCTIRKIGFAGTDIPDPTQYENSKFFRTGIKRYIKNNLNGIFNSIADKLVKKNNIKIDKNLIIYDFFPSPKIGWEEISGRINLLNSAKGEIDTLNKSASFLWKNIVQGKNSYHELYRLMEKKYQVDANMLQKDLESFLKYYVKEEYLLFKKHKTHKQ